MIGMYFLNSYWLDSEIVLVDNSIDLIFLLSNAKFKQNCGAGVLLISSTNSETLERLSCKYTFSIFLVTIMFC